MSETTFNLDSPATSDNQYFILVRFDYSSDLLAFLFSVDKSIGSGCFFPDLDPPPRKLNWPCSHNGNDQFTMITDRIRNIIRSGNWLSKFSINRNFYRFVYDFLVY